MADLTPVTHFEKVIAKAGGDSAYSAVIPITHTEQIIAKYGGGGGGGSSSDYAHSLVMTINDSTFVVTAQLYNKELSNDGTVAYLATDGKVKKLTDGGIKGLRAYFIVPTTGDNARIAFIDFDGDTTGIAEKTMKVNEGIIYDLNGRRVENMGKGIYVVNGKKIVK